MSDADTVAEVRTVEEHVAQAERWANTLPAILGTSGGLVTALDIALMDLYLHAADVHLKLAEAKSRTIVTVADG